MGEASDTRNSDHAVHHDLCTGNRESPYRQELFYLSLPWRMSVASFRKTVVTAMVLAMSPIRSRERIMKRRLTLSYMYERMGMSL